MLLRHARLLGRPGILDLRVVDGRISEISTSHAGLAPTADESTHDAGGALAIPGLWDQHVHVGQVAQNYSRLDTAGVGSVEEALALVRRTLQDRMDVPDALVGFGHRLVDMVGHPTVPALDGIAPRVPVVLIGGDAHHAWMNTAALTALGLPPRDGVVGEEEWFGALPRLGELPGVTEGLESGVRLLQRDAVERGIVGLVDMEWAPNWDPWRGREPLIRVRTASYISDLEAVPGPSGTVLTDDGLITMGPLKIITDGALGSRTALCREPYEAHDAADPCGVLSVPPEELDAALARAVELGLDAAVHAIGDAATAVALDALERIAGSSGAGRRRDRIEHAQMLADEDIARMARLGVTASVQPAHLLDDRDATEELWGDRARQAFRFGDLRRAGVPLALGSDAPVAPLDPWLAMAAAVHRSADERPAWHPDQQLQPREALAASTDGIARLDVGGPGDIVLLEEDVFADVPTGSDGNPEEASAREAAARLRETRPLATFVSGRIVHER